MKITIRVRNSYNNDKPMWLNWYYFILRLRGDDFDMPNYKVSKRMHQLLGTINILRNRMK